MFADDGYAHRKAHYLLEAAVRPPQNGDVAKIATETFTFGTEDGTTLKYVRINDRVRVVLDRNSRGAEILQPFSRTAGGGDVTVVGLDATARGRLWEEAIGGDVRLLRAYSRVFSARTGKHVGFSPVIAAYQAAERDGVLELDDDNVRWHWPEGGESGDMEPS